MKRLVSNLNRRSFLAAAALASLLSFAPIHQAAAVGVGEARTFVQEASSDVLALIKNRVSMAEKRRRFRTLLERKGAVSDVARVAAGRAWNKMSSSQKGRYVRAMLDLVTNLAVDGFKHYTGESLNIIDATKQSKSVFVRTKIQRPGGKPSIDVVWRVIDRNGPLQLFDLIVDGVSLVKTQRDTLASRLNNNGGDVEKFIASLEADVARTR